MKQKHFRKLVKKRMQNAYTIKQHAKELKEKFTRNNQLSYEA